MLEAQTFICAKAQLFQWWYIWSNCFFQTWAAVVVCVLTVHPVVYEIITGNLDAEIQEQQKGMIDFFMEDISKCVDPMYLLPALYANKLLEQSQCERLRCLREQKGPTLGAIFMLCNIHRNNPDWYNTFLGVLMDNDYGELVKNLDEDMYYSMYIFRHCWKIWIKTHITICTFSDIVEKSWWKLLKNLDENMYHKC